MTDDDKPRGLQPEQTEIATGREAIEQLDASVQRAEDAGRDPGFLKMMQPLARLAEMLGGKVSFETVPCLDCGDRDCHGCGPLSRAALAAEDEPAT